MMHRNNCVVTVRVNGKPLREFDHNKESNSSVVLVPFDSEYQLGIKVMDQTRRRVEVSIDGTDVISSLILSPGESLLERFQDVERKFKFVRPSHEGVQDPFSASNGQIVIKLWQEIPAPQVYHHPINSAPWSQHPWYPDNVRYGTGGGSGGGVGSRSYSGDRILCGSISSSSIGADSILCSASSGEASAAVYASHPKSILRSSTSYGEAGATVEGSKSDQKFTTTNWRGDFMSPTVFTITMRGKDTQELPSTVCVGCGTSNRPEAKFCDKCGLRIRL